MPLLPPRLQEHFERPRNSGPLPGAGASGRGENRACGDLFDLHLRVASGRIEEARFQARACSAVIAVGSLLTEALKGLDLATAASIDCDALVREAGGLPRQRAHAVQVATRALERALRSAEEPPRASEGDGRRS